MKSTSIQIQQILDEVHSIKKSISLSSSILTGQVADMCEKAETIVKSNDMSNWERCILYVGVNDAADQCVLKSCHDELWVMINYIRTRYACKISICSACPRADSDVIPINDMMRQLCENNNVDLIDTYSPFIYGDGDRARYYYYRDGIHLNKAGSSMLVTTIDKHVSVTKRSRGAASQDTC